MEANGIEAPPETDLMSANESSAMAQFESSLTNNGSFYTVSMPRKDTVGGVRPNLDLALRRLESKIRFLARDLVKYSRYDGEIRAFEKEGFAHIIPGFNLNDPDQHVGSYYVSHHQRVTEDESRQKWRIVFDCSSGEHRDASLNNHLLAESNVKPDLVKCLLNIRIKPIAVSGDIAKAYMQIRMVPEDHKLFCFLWKGPTDDAPTCYEMN